MQSQNPSQETYQVNTADSVAACLKDLRINACLKLANFFSEKRPSISQLVQTLIVMKFGLGSTINKCFNGMHAPKDVASRSTFYEIMNRGSYNWRKLLNSFSLNFIKQLEKIHGKDSPTFFCADDTTIYRERTSNAQLLSRHYDHTTKRTFKGYLNLSLVWTDGTSHVPYDFALSASRKRVCKELDKSIQHDKRSLSYKRVQEAGMSKLDQLYGMLERAISQGLKPDYLLADSWFCFHSFMQKYYDLGIDLIFMMKNIRCNKYSLEQGQTPDLTLQQLKSKFAKKNKGEICGSVIVYTKTGLRLKLVFFRNRNNKKDVLILGSTDINLTEQQICAYYANRWGIECIFKLAKQELGLEKDCMARKLDAIWAHHSITFIRVIILEWIKRTNNDIRTAGALFAHYSEVSKFMNIQRAIEYLYLKFPSELRKALSKCMNNNNKVQLDNAINVLMNVFIAAFEQFPDFIKNSLYGKKSKLLK